MPHNNLKINKSIQHHSLHVPRIIISKIQDGRKETVKSNINIFENK